MGYFQLYSLHALCFLMALYVYFVICLEPKQEEWAKTKVNMEKFASLAQM